jgi:hypothetical protein
MGLGSLTSRDQSRRIKQLTIFLAIAEQMEFLAKSPIKLYAQDPAFTKVDEAFLESLGIKILRTPSPSILGEAEKLIDEETMVFSPFLTIQAYQNVLKSSRMGMLVGDDFNALRLKWPKFTTEHDDVESLIKRELIKYQRRSIYEVSKEGKDFWGKEDKMFPMALYWRLQEYVPGRERNRERVTIEGGFSPLDRTISARL